MRPLYQARPRLIALILAGFLAGLGTVVVASAQEAAEKPKSDLLKLQGTWILDEIRLAGDVMSIKSPIVIEANTYVPMARKKGPETPYTLLVVRQEAGFVDLIDHQGRINKGIYRLEGDTWEVCQSGPGKPRPTKFAWEKGSDSAISIYKRVKDE